MLELPYPLKEVKDADGMEPLIYQSLNADKAKVLADLYPMTDASSIDNTLLDDFHECLAFNGCDCLVIRWRESKLLASHYFLHTG